MHEAARTIQRSWRRGHIPLRGVGKGEEGAAAPSDEMIARRSDGMGVSAVIAPLLVYSLGLLLSIADQDTVATKPAIVARLAPPGSCHRAPLGSCRELVPVPPLARALMPMPEEVGPSPAGGLGHGGLWAVTITILIVGLAYLYAHLMEPAIAPAASTTTAPTAPVIPGTPVITAVPCKAKRMNKWNEFQHAAGKCNLTRPMMCALYAKLKEEAAAREPSTPTSVLEAASVASWNDFQRTVGGCGLTKPAISKLYAKTNESVRVRPWAM